MFDRRLTPSERAWGVGAACLGMLGLILGSLGGTALLAWLLLRDATFPAWALALFLPALGAVMLGSWTWRTERTPVFAAIAGILGGAGGIAVGLMFVGSGIVLRVLGALGV